MTPPCTGYQPDVVGQRGTGAAGKAKRASGAKAAMAADAGKAADAAKAGDKLERYHAKRDFTKTSEPSGRRRRRRRRGAPRYVVQLHDARRLHYDVRLEVEGVLTSWAVPKGPSFDPGDKRLAVRTEDHPLDYADFEGVIPAGEYGAGPVIVWDTGTYRNLTEHRGAPVAVEEAVGRGHVTVWLEGEKLRGGWAFTRIRGGDRRRAGAASDGAAPAGDASGGPSGEGVGDVWLMVKMRDETADPRQVPVRDRPASVRTGRTLEQLVAPAGRARRPA